MKVLELFAGIGACSVALKRIGINVEIVDAVEIDKYAIASFNAIHGTNFEVQDITAWNKDLKDIDLITHGSPCQDFSVAGKQAGGDLGSGTRSSLMYETIRIVGKIRPKYVLWENVKNILSKKHKHNFDAYIETMNVLGYNNYYQVLNAKDYGIPQNRERVYTVSIRRDIDGYNFIFPKKEELKLRLKDMLENEVDEKYYLSDKKYSEYSIKKIQENILKSEIAGTITANAMQSVNHDNCQLIQVERIGGIFDNDKSKHQAGSVYDKEGLSPTLDAMQGGWRQPMIEVIGNYMPSNHDASRIVDSNGLAPTVKENYGTVTATNIDYRIRKLTPKECWRLMGFDDEDFEKAKNVPTSNTQLYKQARKFNLRTSTRKDF